MRKDVKLGFAIGGVLLAVLIVYVLVVPGGGDKRLTSTSGGDANSQTAHNGGGNGGVSLEPVTPQPATKPSGTAGGGAVATGTPPAAPPTNFTPPAGGTDPFEQPEAAASNKSKEVDWSKLLNDSQTPTLMAPTAKAATTPPHSSSSGSVQTALAGSPSTPDITKPGPTPIVPPAQPKTSPPPAHLEPSAPESNHTADATNTATTPPPPTSLPPAVEPTPPTEVTPPPADHTVANNNSNNATTSTDANGQKTHVVVAGETFSTISLSQYGNPNLYAAIMRANPGIDPTKLRPGMKIVIPPAPEAKPAAATVAPAPAARSHALVSGDAAQTSSSKVEAPIDPQTQYRVQSGDSLYSISKKLYGRGDRFPRIHEANKQLLGDDVNSLKAGQILTLPEPPTVK
jgi:nucleoid-associated protein YgaU